MDQQRRIGNVASIGAASIVAVAIMRAVGPEARTTGIQRAAAAAGTMMSPLAPVRGGVAPVHPLGACARLLHALLDVEDRGRKRDPDCQEQFTRFLEANDLCRGPARATIAMLADPLESRLPQSFDQSLAALILAMERDSSTWVDYWMPWTIDRSSEQQARSGLNLDYSPGPEVAAQVRAHRSECHAEWPGIVVFRGAEAKRGSGAKARSVLLLVGEVPTAGVRKAVLRRAVRMAAWLRGPAIDGDELLSKLYQGGRKILASLGRAAPASELRRESPGPDEPGRPGRTCDRHLHVVGPQFSGSFESMWEALQAERSLVPAFHIVSGSATSAAAARDLLLPAGERSRFDATVIPDDAARAAFYRFLDATGLATPTGDCLLDRVALLQEADTVYGQQAFAVTKIGDCRGADIDYARVQPKYRIAFPIHVSEVRSALNRNDVGGRDPAATTYLNLPRTAVHLDLQERAQEPRDDLPTFSTDTAVYDERALTAALAMLRENRIRVVGILATDPKDKLFLAESVHRSAPDVQLFLFESDNLYTHPEYADILRGGLRVSTYPLVTANQFWSQRLRDDESQRRLQFGLNTSEGIFNAALHAIAADSEAVEYRWPLLAAIEAGSYEQRKPPLWITAIGGNASWPVAALDYDDRGYVLAGSEKRAEADKAKLQLPLVEIQPGLSIFFCLACAASVLFSAVFFLEACGLRVADWLPVLGATLAGGSGRQRVVGLLMAA